LENNIGRGLGKLVIQDEIPEGMTLLSKSNNEPFVKNGNTLSFQMDSLAPNAKQKITYNLLTDQLQKADLFYSEDFEGADAWKSTTTVAELTGWKLNALSPIMGKNSFILPGDTISGQSFLTMPQPIRLGNSSYGLSFLQNYDTQLGFDGGVVELSIDGGLTWQTIDKSKFILNAYPEEITFDSRYVNTVQSFTGKKNTEKSIIDLSEYSNQDILLRFRFYHQEFVETIRKGGWSLDDIQIGTLKTFFSKACVDWGDDIRCVNASSTMNFSDNTVSLRDQEISS
jgi:hypothetical protein